MRTKGLGKKPWVKGTDMPEFSGKSWKELNDLWPPEMRTSSEAYYLLCGLLPAYEKIIDFVHELLGLTGRTPLRFRDIMLLAWCSRCEEAKKGLATEQYAFQKGVNQGLKAFWIRKAAITKLGLIENIDAEKSDYFKAYRVTDRGRIVLRKLVEYIEESHVMLRDVWSKDKPGWTQEKGIDKWIKRNVDQVEFNFSTVNDEDREQIIKYYQKELEKLSDKRKEFNGIIKRLTSSSQPSHSEAPE